MGSCEDSELILICFVKMRKRHLTELPKKSLHYFESNRIFLVLKMSTLGCYPKTSILKVNLAKLKVYLTNCHR